MTGQLSKYEIIEAVAIDVPKSTYHPAFAQASLTPSDPASNSFNLILDTGASSETVEEEWISKQINIAYTTVQTCRFQGHGGAVVSNRIAHFDFYIFGQIGTRKVLSKVHVDAYVLKGMPSRSPVILGIPCLTSYQFSFDIYNRIATIELMSTPYSISRLHTFQLLACHAKYL